MTHVHTLHGAARIEKPAATMGPFRIKLNQLRLKTRSRLP